MNGTRWTYVGCLVVLGLALGCGGGGDEGDGITRGAWFTQIDIFTDGCGPDVYDEMGSDVTYPEAGRIRLSLYLDATGGCATQAWDLFGTETGPGTYDMDDVMDDFVCALEEDSGYGSFDIENATFTKGPSYDRFMGTFTAAYGGGVCVGDIIITLTPR